MQQTDKQTIKLEQSDIKGVYKTIFNRRDVRSQFLDKKIEPDKLMRVLQAAHHAPSVGFMQPWDFTIIESYAVKKKIYFAFEQANAEAGKMFDAEKNEKYKQLKLQGILDSPINICVTCDKNKAGPVVLGRTHNLKMDEYSTVCAIQNLWLAARAEGLGMGWVSIIKDQDLQQILNIPDDIIPVAYLCLGYVSDFYQQPELAQKKWRQRLPLQDCIFFEQWRQKNTEHPLIKNITNSDFVASYTNPLENEK
ncbi:MAG: 5,6-dimethylbenzimidazole synthase [Saccharospirillaceae bacterium]|nr:5,6-dimethylbenzimidazole synthase [Pseudomonadales bacterium]NRB77518.1 5,6-dimethylbenzimidazole synthase [Saccharospirillaceae bacterium]